MADPAARRIDEMIQARMTLQQIPRHVGQSHDDYQHRAGNNDSDMPETLARILAGLSFESAHPDERRIAQRCAETVYARRG